MCVKIDNTTGDAPKLYGRHFLHTDPLISRVKFFVTLNSVYLFFRFQESLLMFVKITLERI